MNDHGQPMREEAPVYSYFSEGLVGKAKFETGKQAYKHFQVEAMREGFEIASRQSIDSLYNTFYCCKGGRQKGANTKKSACQWCVRVREELPGKPHTFLEQPALYHGSRRTYVVAEDS